MARIAILGWCLALLFAWPGCGDDNSSDSSERQGTLELLVGLQNRHDVDGIWVDLERFACNREDFNLYQIDLDLDLDEVDDLRLNGGDRVDFDDDRIRYGAARLIHLPSGCYRLEIQPRTSGLRSSSDCDRLLRDNVEIEGDRTTRLVLKGRCTGDSADDQNDFPRDRCDYSYNDPPTLRDLEVDRYQSYSDCDSVRACATATDPDNHELEFVWEQTRGSSLGSLRMVDRTGTYGEVTECVEIRIDHADEFDFRVLVYDVIDSCDHGRIRLEEWLDREGDRRDSHDTWTFSVDGRDYCYDDDSCDYSSNHEPTITKLTVENLPGYHDCERAQVCADAYDPDGHEVEFVWEQTHGSWTDEPEVVFRTGSHGEFTECVEIDMDYDDVCFDLTVYDLADDCYQGRMRIEDWLESEGDYSGSHDVWDFELLAGDFCYDDDPDDWEHSGRTVVMVVALSHHDIPHHLASRLVEQAVDWVSPVDHPRVMVLLDDEHLNAYPDEALYLSSLLEYDYDAELRLEPDWGLDYLERSSWDVIWFTNPSYRLDDLSTYYALEEFLYEGGGLILSGDDITRPVNGEHSMSSLTHLDHISNGRFTCFRRTDNNQGHDYLVEISYDYHPVTSGLEGHSFLYGDDIDHSWPMGEGERVLAWASLYCSCWCWRTTPVIVAYDPYETDHHYGHEF